MASNAYNTDLTAEDKFKLALLYFVMVPGVLFLIARWGWFAFRVIAFNFGYTIDFQF